LVESLGGESKLAKQIPRGSLLAVAGRLDTQRIVQAVVELNRDGRYLGAPGRLPPAWGPALAVLSGLGPDIGLFLLAPESSASAAAGWPIEWLTAIGSRPVGAIGEQPTSVEEPAFVEQLVPLVRSSLEFAAQLETARKPKRLVQVHSEPVNERGGKLTTVHGLPKLKADEAVSFTVADRTLWVGSNAAVVRNAAQAADRVAPPPTKLSAPSGLFFCDLAALRAMLATSPPTASALGRLLNIEPAEGKQKLADVLTVLRLADSLVVTGGADAQGFSCSWRLATSEEKKAE
jgi:hypothetical protein